MIKKIAEKIGGRPASQVLIATLDLLGIRQLMFNATTQELGIIENEFALIFATVVAQLNMSAEKIKGRLTCEQNKELIAICNSIHYKFFGDTIIISCTLENVSIDAKTHNSEWRYKTSIYFFLLAVKAATYNLMTRGFPVRGCIDTGAALINAICVIGRPFVNSLNIAESLEFAGVVFTHEAIIVCREALTHEIVTPLELNVQTKKGWIRLPCLNWTVPGFFERIKDIGSYLRDQFCANGKLLSASALIKLKNTEQIVQEFSNC